jgi:hypothetical protein
VPLLRRHDGLWSLMTAVDTFYSALARQNLPAAVPVETPETDGLAPRISTSGRIEDAVDVVFSADWRDRAIAAVYACRATHEAVARDMTHILAGAL